MVGAAITLRGARRLSRDDRVAAERSETLRAYRVFVAEAVKSVAELRQLPAVTAPKVVENASAAVMNRLLGKAGAQMALRSRIHRRYGDRHLNLADHLAAATVDLRLRELPPTARAAVDAAVDYVERLSAQRSDELRAEWQKIHARLMDGGGELKLWASRTRPAGKETAPLEAAVNPSGAQPPAEHEPPPSN